MAKGIVTETNESNSYWMAKAVEQSESINQLTTQNAQLIERIRDYETGRKIILPSELTVNQFNQVRDWLEKQRVRLTEVSTQQTPDSI